EASWTPGNQANWKAVLARLMASTGLPLQCSENPEWKKICNHFLTKAKFPSSKLESESSSSAVPSLSSSKLVIQHSCSQFMLQCDGWTGVNHHHLIGFMMTSQQKLYTIHMHNASKDPKTAKELLKQMLLAISSIKMEWGATVTACTMDASGNSANYQCLLWWKFPH
ncbi:hypothetical protein PAXRUDRAFT_153271, partial [Paxillus rubicundulus Ve08.2h10]